MISAIDASRWPFRFDGWGGGMPGRRVAESTLTLSQFMLPEHANNLGNVHGGWLMKLIDEAGGLCATRHARRPAVTVAVDSLRFLSPVHVGDLVTFTACLNYVGRTSMEVEVHVEAENILTGERTHTNSAYLVYVALDEAGKPIEVPRLILETAEERQRWEQAKLRQAERLARAQREDQV
jgi:acyl-CoA hydrolase